MESIAVIFGGVSAEHDVSIVTAINSIIKPLELTGSYTVIPIYISKSGKWYSDSALKDINLYSSGKIDNYLTKLKPISLDIGDGLHIVKVGKLTGSKKIKVDIAFPAMHGTFGEDGDLMGLLDLAGIPYVGCSLSASAVAMDKLLTKQVATAGGFDVTKYECFSKAEIDQDLNAVASKVKNSLKYPVFIKPTHLGSSIGVNQASSEEELKNALEVSATLDSFVIVEEEVANLIELTLPIIGNDKLTPALLERPLTKPEDFFDFETKYMRGAKNGGAKKGNSNYSEIPAKIDKDLEKKAISTALNVYKHFGLSGISRVDLLVDAKTKTVFFNEINPMPGSLYSHNFAKAGISNIELVTKLVDLAKERFNYQKTIQTTFPTNYLKQY